MVSQPVRIPLWISTSLLKSLADSSVNMNWIKLQEFNSASDIPPNILNEILEFFRVYKNLEEKQVVIQGVEPLELAIGIINKSLEDYKEKYLV